MPLTICKVWDYEYPWDVRVAKVAGALTEAGHEVHLTARNRGLLPGLEELPEAVVHRMPPLPVVGRRLNAASMFPAFFNPRWLGLIERTAVEAGADVILARDLPLAPAALRVARKLGVPVVHDMAENYPAMIRDLWLTGAQRPADIFVRNPAVVDRVERWCLRRFDHILVVVEESRERLQRLGVPAARITVVGNAPSASAIGPAPGRTVGRRLEVVYLGIMERARGVSTLIRAVAHARLGGLPIRLTLIGDGRGLRGFRDEAAELGLGPDEVDFRGFVPNEEALAALGSADVGVVPHHVTEQWNATIPNKLFDYMAAGVTVVASDAIPVVRVVTETGCGRIFRDRDVTHLAQVMGELWTQKDLRHYGEAGQAAIRTRHNWETDAAALVGALEATVARGPAVSGFVE